MQRSGLAVAGVSVLGVGSLGASCSVSEKGEIPREPPLVKPEDELSLIHI